uniref:CSON014612 protein n=1 Tax=Culicoides sonorensis TaxID=179676 RepID=A0A336L1W9_CULSO
MNFKKKVDQFLFQSVVAAAVYGVNIHTLRSRLAKVRAQRVYENPKNRSVSTNFSSKQVFNVTQEQQLSTYLDRCSKLHYGLSLKTQCLAYEFARHSVSEQLGH